MMFERYGGYPLASCLSHVQFPTAKYVRAQDLSMTTQGTHAKTCAQELIQTHQLSIFQRRIKSMTQGSRPTTV